MDRLLVEQELPLIAHEQYAEGDPFVTRFYRLAQVVRLYSNELIEQTVCANDRTTCWLAGDVFQMRPRTDSQVFETKVTALSRPMDSNRDLWAPLPFTLRDHCKQLIHESVSIVSQWQVRKGFELPSQDSLVCSGIRILRYPANPRVQARTVSGDLLPGHLDESAITLLLPGGGLQVWRDAWYPVTPNHVQLLVGERFPELPGFRVEATPHRVVPTSPVPKLSVVVFFDRQVHLRS